MNGRWKLETDELGNKKVCCPNCGLKYNLSRLKLSYDYCLSFFSYCPNCGYNMNKDRYDYEFKFFDMLRDGEIAYTPSIENYNKTDLISVYWFYPPIDSEIKNVVRVGFGFNEKQELIGVRWESDEEMK